MTKKIRIIGGGAAGFFAAVTAKRRNPQADVAIIEKTAQLLSKVKISGGGRCNVTHNCFDPKELVRNYPRGNRELLGPFHHFGPSDTVEWFESRGVELKAEEDGRIFPVSNSSGDIINALMSEADSLGVDIQRKTKVDSIENLADCVLLATGSSKAGYAWAEEAGHTIVSPVPSLFTFNVPGFSLVENAGAVIPSATISIEGSGLSETGPLLITHWGFSGPAALKLSAWGARYLFDHDYKVKIRVEWGDVVPRKVRKKIGDVDYFDVEGKSTNKAEFVTCGGVSLLDVNFKTMESMRKPGLFFAGEILDIDGVTGGFNFQNAWTTGYLAGCAMALK